MITTFRIFENKELDKLKDFQDIKLSVLKFTKILENLFLDYYKVKLKFTQEDSPLGIIETYDLRHGGDILCKIYIRFGNVGFDKTYKITLRFFIWNNDFTVFNKFIKPYTKTYESNEFNIMSNNFIDDFDFYLNVKNFNL